MAKSKYTRKHQKLAHTSRSIGRLKSAKTRFTVKHKNINMLRNRNKERFKLCCIYRQGRYLVKSKYIEKHQKLAHTSRSIGRLNSANATFTTKH